MDREGQILWSSWGMVAVGLVIVIELLLSLAQPLYLLSAGATVLIAIVYVRRVREGSAAKRDRVAGRPASPEQRAYRDARYRNEWKFEPAPAPTETLAYRRSPTGCLVLGALVLLVAIGAALVLFVAGGQKSAHFPGPPSGPLFVPLSSAQSATPLPPTDVTFVLSFDSNKDVWDETSIKLSIPSRNHRADTRIERALIHHGWERQPPRTGPDGRLNLRFDQSGHGTVPAHTPTLVAWTATTTVALGIPDSFALGANSRVLIDAPTKMVSATEPAMLNTSPIPGSSSEQTVIAIDANTEAISVTLNGWVDRHSGLKATALYLGPFLLPSGVLATLWGGLRRRRKKSERNKSKKSRPPTTKSKPPAGKTRRRRSPQKSPGSDPPREPNRR